MTTIPRAPAGLQTAGRRLWRDVLADVEMRPDELAVLEAACRHLDLLVALERVLDEHGPTTKGSTGQTRVHPVVAELRQGRLALGKLLGQLGVQDAPGERFDLSDPAQRSSRARRAALSRWATPGA